MQRVCDEMEAQGIHAVDDRAGVGGHVHVHLGALGCVGTV